MVGNFQPKERHEVRRANFDTDAVALLKNCYTK